MKPLFSSLLLLLLFSLPGRSQIVKIKSSEGYVPTRDSVRLFYRILGEGKDTLVVFHGGGFGAAYMIPDLMPLAAHHKLLYFDQPGTGYSTVVNDTARLSIRRFVQDVEGLREYFHFQKMNVLAHSNGGLLFGYYATIHPERVASAILINPTTASQRWANTNRFDSVSLAILKQNRARYRSSPADVVKACWDYYAVWARGKFPTPVHARRIWGDVCNCNQQNLLNPLLFYSLQSMAPWDITGGLARLQARTLIIGGDMDETPVGAWEEWNKSLPHSRLLIIKGTGHLPYVDKPAVFFAAAEQFLSNHWPDDSVTAAGGAGYLAPGDWKGSPYQKARAAVITIENELVHRLNQGAWDTVAAVYAPDATIYGPGSPPVTGRRAIASFWHTASIRGMHSAELQLIDLEQSGDQLIARGKYVLYGSAGDIIDLGKFMAVYRKEKSGWRLHTDIFNTSMETRSPIEVPDYLNLPGQ